MNLSPMPVLPTVPQTGIWYRAVSPAYYPVSALGVAHTVNHASRFYAGPETVTSYQTLYLAHSPEIALREIEALYGPINIPLSNLVAVTIFNAEVQLQRLVDLTDASVQAALQTTVQELTGDWRSYAIQAASAPNPALAPAAPTQALGAALLASGMEGLLTRSAKVPMAISLVVFPQRLQPGSFVRHVDPMTGKTYAL